MRPGRGIPGAILLPNGNSQKWMLRGGKERATELLRADMKVSPFRAGKPFLSVNTEQEGLLSLGRKEATHFKNLSFVEFDHFHSFIYFWDKTSYSLGWIEVMLWLRISMNFDPSASISHLLRITGFWIINFKPECDHTSGWLFQSVCVLTKISSVYNKCSTLGSFCSFRPCKATSATASSTHILRWWASAHSWKMSGQ